MCNCFNSGEFDKASEIRDALIDIAAAIRELVPVPSSPVDGCPCGHEGDHTALSAAHCSVCTCEAEPIVDGTCSCGHPRGWHFRAEGQCIECPCGGFTPPPPAATGEPVDRVLLSKKQWGECLRYLFLAGEEAHGLHDAIVDQLQRQRP